MEDSNRAKTFLSLYHLFMDVQGAEYHFTVLKVAEKAQLYRAELSASPQGRIHCFLAEGPSIKSAKNHAAKNALESLLCDFQLDKEENEWLKCYWFFKLELLAFKARVSCNYESIKSVKKSAPFTQCACSCHAVVALEVVGCRFTGEGHDKWNARNCAARFAYGELETRLSQLTKEAVLSDSMDTMAMAEDPVSALYKAAARQKMAVAVEFTAIEEIIYNVHICVGDHRATGRGQTKQLAKQDAAKKLAQVISAEAPLPVAATGKQKRRKKKEDVFNPNLHAVTYLTQLLQKRGEAPPAFEDIGQIGVEDKTKRTFEYKVTVNNHSVSGRGKTKKEAKANAAEALLVELGIRGGEQRDHTEETAISSNISLMMQ